MKKIFLSLVVMTISLASFAVPARRGFHDFQQPDGTTISLTLAGDEFCHWYESADGTVYKQNADGMFVRSEATNADMRLLRKSAPKKQARRAKKDVGTEPYPAPRGLLILANFSDVSFRAANTPAVMDSLITAVNCQVNNGYGSAAQYFKDQSNGQYQPVFDVFGPVTLSHNQKYYGQNVSPNDEDSEDKYATDAVIEACILANQQYSNLNFADYDWNNDGYVDFVYVIYAGKGAADGGGLNTIWPHNYSVQAVLYYNERNHQYNCYSVYTKNDTKLDGKYLDNYAMSQEIDGQTGNRAGNGTFCHEFGHVIGLPDFYDTDYGNNYENQLTPNEWDVMDGGAYNGGGHCPPNYSAWEKYFMGWIEPENLGSTGANLTLYPNGSAQHNVYQINASGTLQTATTNGLNYYIENRQKAGWDACLPAAGMLIWKVDFNATYWENNEPNLTEHGNPHYTLIIPNGTRIGDSYGAKNVWPYNSNNSWSGVSGKPLLNIAKSGNLITLTYIEEPAVVIDPFELTWMVGSTAFTTTMSTTAGTVVLPTDEPESCDPSKVFVGWTRTANYTSATTAPTFVKAGDAAEEGDIFYAVFATETQSAVVPQTTTYTFTSKNWADATNSWRCDSEANQYTNNQGVQVTSAKTGAGATCKQSFSNVSKVVANYCTNASKGVGSITIKIGNSELTKDVTKEGGTSLRDLQFDFNPAASGVASFEVTCSTNSIYINSLTFTTGGSGTSYSNYTTICAGTGTSIVNANNYPAAVKAIRNGQVVIIRGNEVYNLLGVQQ